MNETVTMERDQSAPPERPWLEVLGSRHFPAWLAEHKVSLAFTTYQLGKLFVVGRHIDELRLRTSKSDQRTPILSTG